MAARTPKTTVELHGDRDRMEVWFRTHGVPHFMHHYSAGSQVPDVSLLLCVVLAFEMAAAPWLSVDTVGMVLSPLILFVMTLIVLPWLRVIFEAEAWPRLSRSSLGVRGAALGVAGVLLLLSPLPPPDDVTWISFVLLLSVFAASSMLFSRDLWTSADLAHVRRRRFLFGAVFATVVVFGLEGIAFDSFDRMLGPGTLPRGLPALAWVLPLIVLAAVVARRCPAETAVPDRDGVMASFQLIAVPLLLLFLGLETALLPYSHPDPSRQGLIELAVFLLILSVAAALAGAARWRTWSAPPGVALLAVLAPLFVAYPSLVWTFFDLEILGHELTGFDAFLLNAGINLVYLGLVWFVVSLGLDRLAVWMAQEAAHNFRGVAEGIARGLPLLLVFMVFLVIQAELWEVADEVAAWEFWLIVGTMLLFALVFIVLSARRIVLEQCVFDGLEEVAAAGAPDKRGAAAPFRSEVKPCNGATRASRLTLRLKRIKYLNALAVLVVYQLIVLLPIAVVAALMFWGLGHIAVSAPVAAEWIYGDEAGQREIAALATRTFWEEPWTRVALVMGAFSALYLTVHILSSPEQRQLFCGGADRAMRKRLAVRLAYVWLVPPDPRRD